MKLLFAVLLSICALGVNAQYQSYGQKPMFKPAAPAFPLPRPPMQQQQYGAPSRPLVIPPRPPMIQQQSYGQVPTKIEVLPPREEPKTIDIIVPREETSYGTPSRPSIIPPRPPMILPPREEQPSYGQYKPTFVPPKPMIQQPTYGQQSYGQQVLPPKQIEFPREQPKFVDVIVPKEETSYGQKFVPPTQQQSYGSYGAQVPSAPAPAPAPAPLVGLCDGRAPGSKLPSQESSSQFYICLEDGEFLLMDCPLHLVFHPESEQCENTGRSLPGCASNPCQNGGICQELPMKQYTCQCQRGFSGFFCDTTDACLVSSCGQAGLCIPLAAGSPIDKVCLCNGGQTYGTDCSVAEPNPCVTNNDWNIKMFPVSWTSSAFIHCEGNIPHMKFCPLTSVYKHNLQLCDWEQQQVLPPTLSFGGSQQQYGSGY